MNIIYKKTVLQRLSEIGVEQFSNKYTARVDYIELTKEEIEEVRQSIGRPFMNRDDVVWTLMGFTVKAA